SARLIGARNGAVLAPRSMIAHPKRLATLQAGRGQPLIENPPVAGRRAVPRLLLRHLPRPHVARLAAVVAGGVWHPLGRVHFFAPLSSTSRALSSGALAGSGSTQRERWQHLAGTGRARQKRRPESGEEDALKGRRCAARGAVPAPAQRVFQDSSIACSSSLRWEIAPFLLATGESHTPWRASSLTSRRSGLLSRKAIAIRLRISSTPRLLRRAVRTRFTNSRRATGPSRRAFAKALAMNSCPRGEASAFRMTSSRSFLVA